MRGIRKGVAVVVAADSLVERVARTIDDMTGHLPAAEEPEVCPLCFTQSWLCTRFDDAAYRVQAAGVRLGELVPQDLHNRL